MAELAGAEPAVAEPGAMDGPRRVTVAAETAVGAVVGGAVGTVVAVAVAGIPVAILPPHAPRSIMNTNAATTGTP